MPSSPHLAERNSTIVAERKAGVASLEELAERYGITVERVRQIQQAGGVDSREAARAYSRTQVSERVVEAEQYELAILMRWINNESVVDIARSLGITVTAAQGVLDERITDETVAARRKNQVRQRFPDADPGPREDREARDDRYWTRERCLIALYYVAQANGGRLPSSTEYKRMSTGNDELPSFPTVRNRCGVWTQVRLDVNDMLRRAAAQQ